MVRTSRETLIIALLAAAVALAALYILYRLVDPLPPRRLIMAAGMAESGYDNFAKQYARILERHGVALEIRNSAGVFARRSSELGNIRALPERGAKFAFSSICWQASFYWRAGIRIARGRRAGAENDGGIGRFHASN